MLGVITLVRYRHYAHIGPDWERYRVERPAGEAIGEAMSDGRVVMGAFDLAIIDGGKQPVGKYACTSCGALFPTPEAILQHRESGE